MEIPQHDMSLKTSKRQGITMPSLCLYGKALHQPVSTPDLAAVLLAYYSPKLPRNYLKMIISTTNYESRWCLKSEWLLRFSIFL